jgi:hypothetical protein
MAKADDLNSTSINFWSAEWVLPGDLYAQFLKRLGSHELAAAALQQMVVLDARVKAGAVQILPDRQVQHFPLEPEFLREKVQFVAVLDWQCDKDFGVVPGTMHKRLQVNVTEPGTWRLFLWREDADALFEATKQEAPVETPPVSASTKPTRKRGKRERAKYWAPKVFPDGFGGRKLGEVLQEINAAIKNADDPEERALGPIDPQHQRETFRRACEELGPPYWPI